MPEEYFVGKELINAVQIEKQVYSFFLKCTCLLLQIQVSLNKQGLCSEVPAGKVQVLESTPMAKRGMNKNNFSKSISDPVDDVSHKLFVCQSWVSVGMQRQMPPKLAYHRTGL